MNFLKTHRIRRSYLLLFRPLVTVFSLIPRFTIIFFFWGCSLTPLAQEKEEDLTSEKWPANYFEAKNQWRDFIESLPQKSRIAWKHEEIPPYQDFPELTTGYFYLPPSAKKGTLLVFISGTHGAEAATGHVFLQILSKNFILPLFEEVEEESPSMKWSQDKGLLLVHVLNPYGYHFFRRVNRNNVDLNRNFISPDEKKENQINDELYSQWMKKLLSPKAARCNLWDFGHFLFNIGLTWLRHSEQEIRNVSVGGQYREPQLTAYGGSEIQPEGKILIQKLEDYTRGYNNILFIDIHTGLGERGILYILADHSYELDSDQPKEVGRRDGELKLDDDPWEKFLKIRTRPPQNEFIIPKKNSRGFYKTRGDLVNYLVMKFQSEKVKSYGATVEFGTRSLGIFSQLQSLYDIICENQGYQWGYQSESDEDRIKRRFKDLFEPDDLYWKAQVEYRSLSLLKRIFR